ncbi:MAG: hypothetical protein HQ549_02545 [Candidatus Omnitrophica bacterium]|nr:hypothetical protein [Candidatus Omnitrophota bacterium]
MKTIFILILIFLLFTSGCGKVSESALDEVVLLDPSFKEALETKSRIDAEILTLKNDFSKEEGVATQKMRELRENLKLSQEAMSVKIISLRQEIAPDINALGGNLEEVHEAYKVKKKYLKSAMSKLKSIKDLLNKKGELSLPGNEISVWDKRATKLEKEINSVKQSLDQLRTKIRILKIELKILQQ